MTGARNLTLGRIVHFVTEDYECPAMIVGTARHFDDPEDVRLQYGEHFNPYKAITIVVHHPWTRLMTESDTGESIEVPQTEMVVNPREDSSGDTVGTYHWPDQCPVT